MIHVQQAIRHYIYIWSCIIHRKLKIIKNLPENIQRISKLSSSIRIFNSSKNLYNNALSASEFEQGIKFEQSNTSATPNKNRKMNIIWFNPPSSAIITTKIGNKFLEILYKHFPKSLSKTITFLATITLKLTIAPYQILPA